MPFSRFFVPVWPSLALLLASWLVALRHSLSRRRTRVQRRPERTASLFTALLVACTLGTYGPEIERYARNEGLQSMLMRGEDQLRVGVWLSKAVKPGGTVRTARLGGMSYEAPELTFWDDNGLTDREQALWISRGRIGGATASPVSKREPDAVAALLVPERWSYTEDEDFVEWLKAGYSLASRFPQGNHGEVHIWVAKPR